MGCATKNAKVVAISFGSLHRLISLKAVPLSAVPSIIDIMGDCINQGVDIQLRILQTLLSLITNFPSVHGELLGDVGHIDSVPYLNIYPSTCRRLYSYVSSSRNLGLQSYPLPLLPHLGSLLCLWLTKLSKKTTEKC